MIQSVMDTRFIGMSLGVVLLGLAPAVHADDLHTSGDRPPGNVADDFADGAKRVPMHFTPRLDAQIPLNLQFRNDDGALVELGTLVQQKPVILNMVYFDCPMMCTEVLNGLAQAMRKMRLQLGKDYNVITLSIDDREKPSLAKTKKKMYSDRYHRPGTEPAWSFLTGDAAAIKSLADAVGFEYKYYPDIDQFDHPLGIMVLTPEGKVARYLYGVQYKPDELSSALVDASKR
jgi:protein SCO1